MMKIDGTSPVCEATLLISRPAEGVAQLTLNRPERLNALTLELQRALDDEITLLGNDDEVRAIVLTGAGRAFCAGNDIDELAAMSATRFLEAERQREEWHWRVAINRKPLVVALNGLAIGAGSILATSADIRIGCPATALKYGSAQYGGVHCTWSLPPIVGLGKAKEFLYTSKWIAEEEALSCGLLNFSVPAEELVPRAVEFAASIAANSTAVQDIKESLHANIGLQWESQYRRENRLLRALVGEGNPAPAAFADFFKGRENQNQS